ncbi:atherin-like [Motacilla alba alba]|uniref:atherin-like n=1 Tax=Motacilla alba alba TaxID=1094192 RepID=UPI0018D561A2|nr:atherin-like [Motacilla alba alba]XP_038005011.1 atherin-like [Motacilla alba alba]
MKRGSLRCELDSAPRSGLQQAAMGGTGGERLRPCGQSPVHRLGAGARPTPGHRDRAGAPRAARAARRARRAPIGCAARAARPHWLRHAPSAAEGPSAAHRRAPPSHAPGPPPGPTNDLTTSAALPADRPLAEPPACNSGGTAPRAEEKPPGDSLSTRWRRWPPARAQAGLLPPPLGPFPSPPVQPCVRLEEAQAWQ